MRASLWITLSLIALTIIIGAVNFASAATPGFKKYIDPVERSFSVEMPDGWQNALGLTRSQGNYKLPRSWASSSSPDGATQWFIGDPNVPLFHKPLSQEMIQSMALPPQQAREQVQSFFKKEGVAIRPFQSAQQFAEDYAQRRYGNQPGFQLLGHAPNPELDQAIAALDQRLGNAPRPVDTTKTRFEFQGHTGELWVSSGEVVGDANMWGADVAGFTTATVDSNAHSTAAKLFARSKLSLDISPKWVARARQQSQQRVAQLNQQMAQQRQTMNQQHQQRMAMMQNNFNAHQARMADRSAAMDQQHQSWQNSQNQNYQQHQSFIRGIQDRTVVNSPNSWGGSSFEVDAGANNYYVDPLNNQYFGTDTPLEPGQIPDGYQQATEQGADW